MNESTHAQKLPTSRAFLTSLFTTLFQTPSTLDHPPLPQPPTITNSTSPSTSTATATAPKQEPNEEASNPLKNLPASQKALLSTLHVLFPPPTLLQALDLLDRGLVMRVVWYHGKNEHRLTGERVDEPQNRRESQEAEPKEQMFETEQAPPIPHEARADTDIDLPHIAMNPSKGHKAGTSPPPLKSAIYQVRSSHLPSSTHPIRGGRSHASMNTAQKTYTVHLEAWNCTCAAFAFSAFPYLSSTTTASGSGSGSGVAWRDIFHDEDEDALVGEEEEEEDGEGFYDHHHPTFTTTTNSDTFPFKERSRSKLSQSNEKRDREKEGDDDSKWEFGGLSFDGRDDIGGGGGGSVPICKHLLAVLLVEKWDLLSTYIVERKVFGERGREEVAGLVAAG